MPELTQPHLCSRAAHVEGTLDARHQSMGKHLEGRAALVLKVVLALGCGVAAAAHVGVTIAAQTSDPIGFAAEVLKVAIAVLFASQGAFRILMKPVANPLPE